MPGKPLTALMAWKLHLHCSKAVASGNYSAMQKACESVCNELGEALTYMLTPHVPELDEPAPDAAKGER